MSRKRLLFVSPRFLFPADSGGAIRTSQILRGLKGGRFDVTLAGPAPPAARERYAAELDAVADRFAFWPQRPRGALFALTRMRHLLSPLPIPVATDRSPPGSARVARELADGHDVVVFDFAHSVVLAPPSLALPSVLFTHNVEAEIFRRHCEHAANPVTRWVWRNQLAKMERFEREAVERFDVVVAVSERDGRMLRDLGGDTGARSVEVIRTGVDLDFFAYAPPQDAPRVVFMGAMDWLANIDGVEFFLDRVWPAIARERPDARMTVVGRNPPPALVGRAAAAGDAWSFTGFADDVRPHVRGAAVFVIPLRVGGGTRIKAFEAMALGCPVVSTAVGVEGLPVVDGEHYLRADDPGDFAAAVLRLLADASLRERLSASARAFVAEHCSFRAAAGDFERACVRAMEEAA